MQRFLHLPGLAIVLLLLPSWSYAVPIQYIAHLDGPSESPPVPSPGSGTAFVELDIMAHTLQIDATFGGLIGTTTVAHIHCCTLPTAGVAVTPGTLPGFPAGVTSGSYSILLDTTMESIYTAGFLAANGGTAAGAEAALAAGLAAGLAYFNIHTSFRPGGEIRGFFQPVPEPGTFGLLVAGALGLAVMLRKRRS